MVTMSFSMLRSALRLPLVLLAVFAATVTAHAQTSPQKAMAGRDFIVAVVDALPITNHDVQLRAEQLRQQLSQQGRSIPPTSSLLREALEGLINEKALLQFAKETGVEAEAAPNEQVTGAPANSARERQEQRDQLTLRRLTERNVPARIKISDLEIEQALRERQGAQVNSTSEIELGHILIALPENASEAHVSLLQAKAQSTLSRLKRGDNFAVVAKEVSDSPDRDQGGLMGWRPADRYPTLFVEATQGLSVGELSPVVRSGAGFHILKLVSKRSNNTMTVTETRVRHILLRPSSQLSQTAARARLAESRRQIEAGKADFGKVAQDISQDASAANGGDLGWVGPGMFVPEFEQVMNQLAVGQLSDPVISRFGVHLIQVLARRDAALSEREMRDIVRNSLREKKYDETLQLWVQEVRGRAYVEYRDSPQ